MGVVNDSGGITEETTVTGVRCMTLRDNTDRPKIVEIDTNQLVETEPPAIPPAIHRLLRGDWKKGHFSEKWDAKEAYRIVEVIHEHLHTFANDSKICFLR